tara:strand:+ start:1750 stop:2613 length:864 start_codon:yes stop_codon:yes gene_type:complete
MDYLKELDEKGYVVVPNVLDTKEVEYCKHEFKSWQSTIPNHDMFHKYLNPNGIYKYHRVGHTKHAWFIRTRPKVQDVFKALWKTDELVVSFDGACYVSKDNMKSRDKIWTHTDQASKCSDIQCYQGFVSLTENKERSLVVYEGSHKLHETYFKDRGMCDTKNWQLIDHDYLEEIKGLKKVLHVPAGALVVWDSRTFHQNQLGKPGSEERLVQYVSYLPKDGPKNSKAMRTKRLKYLQDQRTTSHWAYPIKVNSLQAMTYGNKLYAIDYEQIPMTDLSEFEEDIHKIV